MDTHEVLGYIYSSFTEIYMENSDDLCYEKPAYWYNGRPLKAAKLCPKCAQVKLMPHFRRYLTPAEARSHGYSGEARVEVETASCKVCTPPRTKPLHRMTDAEIRRKVESGDLRIPARVLKEREDDAIKQMNAGTKMSHESRRSRKWEPFIDALRAEVDAVMQQQKYARTRLAIKGTSREMKANWHEHNPVLAFCDAYIGILRNLRSSFVISKRKAQQVPEHDRWQDYLTKYERNVLIATWEDIQPMARSMMRKPKAFMSAEEEKEVDRQQALKKKKDAPPPRPIMPQSKPKVGTDTDQTAVNPPEPDWIRELANGLG